MAAQSHDARLLALRLRLLLESEPLLYSRTVLRLSSYGTKLHQQGKAAWHDWTALAAGCGVGRVEELRLSLHGPTRGSVPPYTPPQGSRK